MLSKILLIGPAFDWLTQVSGELQAAGHYCVAALNGKEAQLVLYKEDFDYVFIDLETTDHSAVEVIKYMKASLFDVKYFAFTSNPEKLVELSIEESWLAKNGIVKTLYSPGSADLLSAIKGLAGIKVWDNLPTDTDNSDLGREDTISDNQFTRIKIDDFFSDEVAVINYYLRLASNRYIKIINAGEKSPIEQIQKYAKSGTQYLYFMNKDRAGFVSYQNEISRKLLEKNEKDSAVIIKSLKTTADKLIDEMYSEGIQPQLIEEGKAMCNSMYSFIEKDNTLRTLLGNLEDFNPTAYSHSFLVCFFSVVICKNLNWVGTKTQEALALGGMLHDIGILQIPEEIILKDINLLTEAERKIYEEHPLKGYEMLKNVPGMNTSILQAILQHHETSNGLGYPSTLTSNKIFPLAKIIGLSDAFTDFIVDKELAPMVGLKEFLSLRENLMKHDSDLIRNFVSGFISNGNKKLKAG